MTRWTRLRLLMAAAAAIVAFVAFLPCLPAAAEEVPSAPVDENGGGATSSSSSIAAAVDAEDDDDDGDEEDPSRCSAASAGGASPAATRGAAGTCAASGADDTDSGGDDCEEEEDQIAAGHHEGNDDGEDRAEEGQDDSRFARLLAGTADYGVLQLINDSDPDVDKIRRTVAEMDRYMRETAFLNSDEEEGNGGGGESQHLYYGTGEAMSLCRNAHELCAFWASGAGPGATSECDANPTYMRLDACAPACRTCREALLKKSKCAAPLPIRDGGASPRDAVGKEGDLNAIFVRMTATGAAAHPDSSYREDDVTILSHPGMMRGHKAQPWIITIDNFLTLEECETLIRLGAEQGYTRSLNVGKRRGKREEEHQQQDDDDDGDGGKNESPSKKPRADSGRTSTNAWCLDECYDHPVTRNVIGKIENLTGIPDANSEYLQLLKYEEG
jgi:hypothetical protein